MEENSVGVPLAAFGSALLTVSAFGVGPPRPLSFLETCVSLKKAARRHRAPARPPVRPNAPRRDSIRSITFSQAKRYPQKIIQGPFRFLTCQLFFFTIALRGCPQQSLTLATNLSGATQEGCGCRSPPPPGGTGLFHEERRRKLHPWGYLPA